MMELLQELWKQYHPIFIMWMVFNISCVYIIIKCKTLVREQEEEYSKQLDECRQLLAQNIEVTHQATNTIVAFDEKLKIIKPDIETTKHEIQKIKEQLQTVKQNNPLLP